MSLVAREGRYWYSYCFYYVNISVISKYFVYVHKRLGYLTAVKMQHCFGRSV